MLAEAEDLDGPTAEWLAALVRELKITLVGERFAMLAGCRAGFQHEPHVRRDGASCCDVSQAASVRRRSAGPTHLLRKLMACAGSRGGRRGFRFH